MLPNLEIVFRSRKKKKEKETKTPKPRAQTAAEVRPSYLRRYGPGVVPQPSACRCVCANKNEFHMAGERRVAPARPYLQG